jgi:hypothetical protein
MIDLTKPCVYLGAPEPAWIGRTEVPLFVSYGRLRRLVRKLPVSPPQGGVALDSRGFQELAQYGRWTFTPEQYVADVLRYDQEIGNLEWASIMDWMTEPEIMAATGLTEDDHLHLTVANYLRCTQLWEQYTAEQWRPNPFMVVLQGSTEAAYHRCWDYYEDAGVDVSNVEVVGVGSICTRQHTAEIGDILGSLQARDPEHALPIHAFGMKTKGLHQFAGLVGSTDSQAWSDHARHGNIKMVGCTAAHKVCNYCLPYALSWREQLLTNLGWLD